MAHSLLFDSPNSEIYEANNSKKFVAGYFLYSVAIQSIIKARNRIEMRGSLKNK